MYIYDIRFEVICDSPRELDTEFVKFIFFISFLYDH